MSNIKIKVCGMTDLANLELICSLRPDYLGYIFYAGSPRYVGEVPDMQLFSQVPDEIVKTGVFVNESYEMIVSIADSCRLNAIQLHGSEDPALCAALSKLGLTVIKAIPGNRLNDDEGMKKYIGHVDYLLFDTPAPTHGGSGIKFNWTDLDQLDTGIDFFLSGGISLQDVQEIRHITNKALYAVDINSKFETAPGLKDPGLVEKFIKEIRDGE